MAESALTDLITLLKIDESAVRPSWHRYFDQFTASDSAGTGNPEGRHFGSAWLASNRWLIQLDDAQFAAMARTADRIAADPLLRRWAAFYLHLLLRTEEVIRAPFSFPFGALNLTPYLGQANAETADCFYSAAMLAGLDESIQFYTRQDIGLDDLRPAWADLAVWMKRFYSERGYQGNTHNAWMSHHARGQVVQLGRLQFVPEIWSGSSTVRRHADGRFLILMNADVAVTADGLQPSPEEATAWTTAVEITEREGERWITAHPVNEAGSIERSTVTVREREWPVVLQTGDRTVAVHISEGSPLWPEECRDSLIRARCWLRGPDAQGHAWAGRFLTCSSWLLDPRLRQVLPAESNIVAFQDLFHLQPHPGDPSQAFYYVFGEEARPKADAPANTRLARGILNRLAQGGTFGSGAGFIEL